MKNVLIVIAVLAAFVVSTANGQTEQPGWVVYLGLGMPYPEQVPVIDLAPGDFVQPFNRAIDIDLSISEKGRVEAIDFAPDSSGFVDPIRRNIENLRFRFLDGRRLTFPISLPMRAVYANGMEGGKRVSLHFPAAPQGDGSTLELVSDTGLLVRFFDNNNITRPRLTAMFPVYYRVDRYNEEASYLTVTAYVELDSLGRMQDVRFPLAGHDDMTHAVLMALIRATYTPAALDGEPFATGFFLTFRIFDNIYYPYNPLAEPDSGSERSLTEKHFLCAYYNPVDIHMGPLPRMFPHGYVPSSGMTKKLRGYGQAWLRFNEYGAVVAITDYRATPDSRDRLLEVFRQATWYPATDRYGRGEGFSGMVRFEARPDGRVVYNPEWLK